MRRATLYLALLAVTCAADAAQPLGRLFFTPAERAQLDVARANKRVAEPASAKPSEPPPPQTRIITYSGIVRRSDGKSILWLNNRPEDEKEALSNLPVKGRVRADGGVTLTVPETGGTIDLKVGQRAELQTGRVSETRPPAKDAGADKAKDTAKGDPAKAGAPKPDTAKGEAAKADAKAPAPKPADSEKKADPPKGTEPDVGAARPAGK